MRALIRELIETVILALMIFLVLQVSIQNFQVEGSSMEPTLTDGQYLLVNKLVYLRMNPRDLSALLPFVDEGSEDRFAFRPPRRGEVVIFRFPRDPSRDFVKRVIGLPGEEIKIRRGIVLINGIMLDEPYITNRDRRSVDALEVPPETYFVMGDNRGHSQDSRDWGPMPSGMIIGRGWVSIWPLGRWHTLSAFLRP